MFCADDSLFSTHGRNHRVYIDAEKRDTKEATPTVSVAKKWPPSTLSINIKVVKNKVCAADRPAVPSASLGFQQGSCRQIFDMFMPGK